MIRTCLLAHVVKSNDIAGLVGEVRIKAEIQMRENHDDVSERGCPDTQAHFEKLMWKQPVIMSSMRTGLGGKVPVCDAERKFAKGVK